MSYFIQTIIVVTGSLHALHPPSNVETINPITLHLGGEFAESNLGTAAEPDGSVTVRMIAEQYSFVPTCAQVPVDTPVKFRITSTDAIHGFLLPATNVNTMVVPGYVAEVRTTIVYFWLMPVYIAFYTLAHKPPVDAFTATRRGGSPSLCCSCSRCQSGCTTCSPIRR